MKATSKSKKRRWLRITGIFFLLLLIGAGAYGYSVYKSLTSAVETMHEPVKREKSEKRTEDVTLEKKDPFSVLMLGVDEREGDKGRSDTLIVLTVNPNNNTVKMLSIPRDTRTEIVGKGKEDKINHAYAYGGVEMAMNTVENFLDIPIDYYIQINMEGFEDIVDAVGGVTVNNDLEFTLDGAYFPVGQLQLNGEKALKFSRMRYEDPRGDYGRQIRQREIIQAVVDSGVSMTSLAKYNEIFTALGNNIKTNLTFDEMIDIQQNYQTAASTIEQMDPLTGQGTKINSVYYILVSDEEQQRVQNELKTQLEIPVGTHTAQAN
ncbi:LytR family transcriptional regulator [Bacillus sp. DNRA2]|uniref:polyisoprenyl-teichoic acid--peptidoglycan teichoic acid transferase TagU n=1 Tax=Bacillus sp. DNRA2 TaxID=2723053 RepID=UPI00145E1226|nr:LytR family transcriptional regulator [Bacillus sp. DNRA2]NMD68796.1 LytR family transcriptional regulator [Bacillus sp. DNRA2]